MTTVWKRALKIYIDCAWVDPVGNADIAIVNPATKAEFARLRWDRA